jgi:hypothetical protein
MLVTLTDRKLKNVRKVTILGPAAQIEFKDGTFSNIPAPALRSCEEENSLSAAAGTVLRNAKPHASRSSSAGPATQ